MWLFLHFSRCLDTTPYSDWHIHCDFSGCRKNRWGFLLFLSYKKLGIPPHFFATNVRYVVLSSYLGFRSFQLLLSVQMLQRPPISFSWWKLADIKPLLNRVHPIGISSISWHFCWYIWIVFLYCVSDEELSVCGHQEYHWAMFFPFCYSQLSSRMTSLYIQCCARTQPRMPTVLD